MGREDEKDEERLKGCRKVRGMGRVEVIWTESWSRRYCKNWTHVLLNPVFILCSNPISFCLNTALILEMWPYNCHMNS